MTPAEDSIAAALRLYGPLTMRQLCAYASPPYRLMREEKGKRKKEKGRTMKRRTKQAVLTAVTAATLGACDDTATFRTADAVAQELSAKPEAEGQGRAAVRVSVLEGEDGHSVHVLFSDGETGWGAGWNAYRSRKACALAMEAFESACLDYQDIAP